MTLYDGEYTVNYSCELDRGYGIESAADEVVIEIHNGTVNSVTAYGCHFVTDEDVEWYVNIYDDECIELILDKYPDAHNVDADLDAEADRKLDLIKEK